MGVWGDGEGGVEKKDVNFLSDLQRFPFSETTRNTV